MKASILILLLIGCSRTVATSQSIRSPNGLPGSAVWCKRDVDCWELAGKACPNGYAILNSSNQDGWSVSGNGGSFAGGQIHNHTLVVECKAKERSE